MLALAAWAAEFILESLGAYLALRRRILPLGTYLLFRASSDLVTIAIMYSNHGGDLYAWSYWVQQAGAALLLCWLSVAIMAQMVGETQYGPHAAFIQGLGVIAAMLGVARADRIPMAILGAALNFDLVLGLAMLVGLLSQKVQLSGQWTAIAWGVCIQLGSEGLVRGVAHYKERALSWLPLGAIVALGVWVMAVLAKKQIGEEIREVAPPKFEPESIKVTKETYKGWVN